MQNISKNVEKTLITSWCFLVKSRKTDIVNSLEIINCVHERNTTKSKLFLAFWL